MGRITFLGTGDPLNHERAQTALALDLPDGETLLVDTSSGTVLLTQLRAAGIPLERIRHLFVSHRHFDHAGGLAPLLVALVAAPAATVTVHALPETERALHELLQLTIPGVETWLGSRLRWQALAPDEPVQVADIAVTPFLVEHGIECVGFQFARGGKRAVFTADTQPCDNVGRYAKGAELLIHEVYSLDADARTAHLFGHSTARDAGDAAHAAGVGRLLLTHFRASQFSVPATLCTEAAEAYGRPVDAAADLDAIEF